MISTPSYKKALFSAIALHAFLLVLLLTDTSSQRPVLTKEVKNSPGLDLPMASAAKPEIVKAVSIDNKEVMDTVNRLKQEREQQKQAELNRQRELNRQLEAAKQQRIQEQKQIAKLKEEANRIAIARKKQVEEEKKRLKELAEQKAREAKHVEELKKQKEELVKQKELEAKKLAELNKKKAEEKTKAEKLEKEKKLAEEKAKADKARADQAKADLERKQQEEAAAKQQAAANAEKQARIAGEVDKYKALIVNAIGRHWILPDNADSSLSSQFRIRLAPNGEVLEVSLTKSSGDALLDRSAQTAIHKASPLPVPTDSETFSLFRDISLTVRPEQVRG
ncbi:cell envelope integrity protein TolA [Legionella sp. km772]|uniref:cell envelope integrity protein TolA n=1 Tax=Legionella sp. km772 TaxID=2498111 RepID=UPI000F8F7380|nr:cell envelope integrity protein TolA [Legionella sp. km772]RUR13187.1 cell envelope integrity protein TolA [Legionella sp. km772]